ncbi:hypothetical protein CO046_03230 [Candidatus Peregrinibacteria bacterium CG_4_9_14_0_2_um_filter_53_11]|nr:MAG: hypothetical protein CO046_03230 [Candidatus Peregrinibacteria bacterium CG_4_9_14_0_2_um_filter_53_11]
MFTTQDDTQAVTAIPAVKELVNNLLILLSPKEKHIIENRYSLNGRPHSTLERIGQEFGVTRERIRQIEKNALKKLSRNVVNTKLNIFNQLGNTIIQKYEGLVLEERIISEILSLVSSPETVDRSSIRLSLELDSNLERVPNTINCYPYFKLKTLEKSEINRIASWALKYLTKKKTVEALDALVAAYSKEFAKNISKQFMSSALSLDRRLKLLKKGVGLASWRSINPRTLRDKITYILKDHGKSLHYVEIANRIAESKFDKKMINVQAVHNELIRDETFVLIGRGIYALRAWGYVDGTVADVIADILRTNGSLERDAIIAEVLKRRQVKRITIILNLKNKPIFERVGRNVYSLKG